MARQAKIKLNKQIYGVKGTHDFLDKEFKELIIKKFTTTEFFDLYRDLFFDIEKEGRLSHKTIVAKSTEYAGTPPNPKDQTIIDLKERKQDIQWEIDSIEEEHPFLPNNSTVLQSRNEPSLKYLIQSGRRRQIKDDKVFDFIKERNGYTKDTPNENFAVLLNADAISGIIQGPNINKENDVGIDVAFINRYTPGVNQEDPLDNINIKIEKPDLRKGTAIPEIYNPMVNVEEPSPLPEALDLSSVMNTNSFNQSNTPLNNYRYNSNNS
tara:strand:- start:6535 stop:7335 length:801 start_codon:yes stop_codon:yes gene_type:complete